MTPDNTELQKIIDYSVDPVTDLVALFQAHEQQLLIELLDEAADFGEGYAVPVSVIERYISQTKDSDTQKPDVYQDDGGKDE